MMNTYRLAYTRERAAYKQRIGMKTWKELFLGIRILAIPEVYFFAGLLE